MCHYLVVYVNILYNNVNKVYIHWTYIMVVNPNSTYIHTEILSFVLAQLNMMMSVNTNDVFHILLSKSLRIN